MRKGGRKRRDDQLRQRRKKRRKRGRGELKSSFTFFYSSGEAVDTHRPLFPLPSKIFLKENECLNWPQKHQTNFIFKNNSV